MGAIRDSEATLLPSTEAFPWDEMDDLGADSLNVSSSDSESDSDRTLLPCRSASNVLLSPREVLEAPVFRLDILEAYSLACMR